MFCEVCFTETHIKHGYKDGHVFCFTCYTRWREKQPKRKDYKKAYHTKNYSNKKDDINRQKRIRYKHNRKEILSKSREHSLKLRKAALLVLGNKCACCGVTEWWNLTIDHIQPLLDKPRVTWQKKQYYNVINDPDNAKETYQTLCFGCNTSKNKYKKCELNHSDI